MIDIGARAPYQARFNEAVADLNPAAAFCWQASRYGCVI
jgi:hypothetical protein